LKSPHCSKVSTRLSPPTGPRALLQPHHPDHVGILPLDSLWHVRQYSASFLLSAGTGEITGANNRRKRPNRVSRLISIVSPNRLARNRGITGRVIRYSDEKPCALNTLRRSNIHGRTPRADSANHPVKVTFVHTAQRADRACQPHSSTAKRALQSKPSVYELRRVCRSAQSGGLAMR
jgi:hypothetical protein